MLKVFEIHCLLFLKLEVIITVGNRLQVNLVEVFDYRFVVSTSIDEIRTFHLQCTFSRVPNIRKSITVPSTFYGRRGKKE